MTQHDSQKRYRFYGPRMPIFPSREALYAYENAMNAASKLPDQSAQPALSGQPAWNDMRREEREAYQAKLRAMTWKESIARWRRLLNEGFSDEDRAYLFVNEFDESEHKRDKDGKFATMDGGGAKSRARRDLSLSSNGFDWGKGLAANGGDFLWEHHQLIADDGTNIGLFSGTEYRSDTQEEWKKYTYRDENTYNAELIEEAIRIHKEINKNTYNIMTYNCINYVEEIVALASYLSQKKNVPLYVKEESSPPLSEKKIQSRENH